MAARCCWRAVAERGAWRRSMTEPSGARHNGTAAARDAPTGRPRYAELHAHSAFSFLDGASQPEELAVEAARLGLSALALTDHDGLYGVVRFAQVARAVGLPTVIGAELHLPDATGALDAPTGLPDSRSTHLVVLARGPEGYRRLSRAIAEGTWPPVGRALPRTPWRGSRSRPVGTGSCSRVAARGPCGRPLRGAGRAWGRPACSRCRARTATRPPGASWTA